MGKINKTLILSFLVFLVLVSSVTALDFLVNATPIKKNIEITETAKYNLEIKNLLSRTQAFRIYSMDYPIWDVYTVPLQNPILIEVPPSSKSSLELVINPLDKKGLLKGAHFVNLKVSSRTTNQVINVPLEVIISSTDALIGGYVPTILTGAKIKQKIDPREDFQIEINLNNQNRINYSELTVNIESGLIKDSVATSLDPLGENTLILTEKLDDYTPPQKDSLKVSVLYGDRLISSTDVDYEIIEYSTISEDEPKESFLKSERTYRILSNNPYYNEDLKIEVPLLESFFSSTEPRANVLKENSKRYFVWDVSLGSDHSMTVSVRKSYRAFVFVILLIILSVIAYFYIRSPLTISKRVTEIKRDEGGISSLKIIITVKNRSQEKLQNIEIEESVPNIAEVQKDLYIGTLAPTKVLRHESKGYVIKWNLDSFDIGEERVLAYKVKSKLPVLGNFSLPPTTARFRYKNKDRVSHSNRVNA